MAAPLPQPREMLTSLLTTLFTSTPTQPKSTQPTNPPYTPHQTNSQSPAANPLLNLPTSQRALLATLHVLFPPPTLLQALDLLDRGLVTRHILTDSVSGKEDDGGNGDNLLGSVMPVRAHVHLQPSDPTSEDMRTGDEKNERSEDTDKRMRNVIYQVKSSQSTASGKGRYRDHLSAGATYTVHLNAWNCSCAAFTFSAFPSTFNSSPWLSLEEGDDWGSRSEGKEWSFGGFSRDGRDGGGVPVCKHLLACLLGERWEAVLGGFVKERVVEREEMAGLGGE